MPSTPTLADETARYLLDVVAKRDPYDLLNRLRETEPVHQTAAGTWIISDLELGLAALRDLRFARDQAVAREIEMNFAPSDVTDVYRNRMMNQDGANHLRLRRLLAFTFSPNSVQAWRPAIERDVDELFDRVEPLHQADLVREISYPIPEHVICTLLGVPFEDHELFEKWSAVLNVRPQAGGLDETQRQRATSSLEEFAAYLRGLVEQRRAHPGDDLISKLVAIEEEGERLNDIELVAVLTEVINGGHDTTANAITNGALMLILHPDEFARLKADPTLVPTAVDELLRFRSPVQLTLTRHTTEDVEIGGVTVPAGQTVVIALAAANREGRAFDDPQRFDVGRMPNKHVAFGAGRHVCLGAHLARAELQITLERIVRLLPDLRLDAELEELPWRTTTLVMAPSRLPVAW